MLFQKEPFQEKKQNRRNLFLNRTDDNDNDFQLLNENVEVITNFVKSNFTLNLDQINGALSYLEQFLYFSTNKDLKQSTIEHIIDYLINIFMNMDQNEQITSSLLTCFWLITWYLTNEEMSKYFTNHYFFEKVISFINPQSNLAHLSSIVASHLLYSNSIEFDIDQLIDLSSNINDSTDRSFYLLSLSNINININFMQKILPCIFNSIDVNNSESVENCCYALCNLLDSWNDTVNEDAIDFDFLKTLFIPQLPNFLHLIDNNNFTLWKPVINLLDSILDFNICREFFSSNETVNYLNQLINIPDHEKFFTIILPFLSKIYYQFRNVLPSPDYIHIIIQIAMQGSFKIRKPAVLFICSIIQSLIHDEQNYFPDQSFYELLIEMAMSDSMDIMEEILDCMSQLLSTNSGFYKYLEENGIAEDLIDALDEISESLEDPEADRTIFYIKRSIQSKQPREYEH